MDDLAARVISFPLNWARHACTLREMKALRPLLLLLLCWGVVWPGYARWMSVPLHHTQFNGQGYVSIGEFAKINNLNASWVKTGTSIVLSDHFTRIVLNKDSREAELNGIKICLSYPILIRNGAGFIADVDLETAVRPVLSPPRNYSWQRVRNIVIDPGHGGKDPGEHEGLHQEKTYTLLLAQELQNQLKLAGFNVSMTRTTDTFVDLPVRGEIARRRGADLFISLHWNTITGKSDIKGAQTFCMTPAGASSSNAGGEVIRATHQPGNRNNEKNMFLAFMIQRSLLNNLKIEDRGVRRARYEVLREAEMPAVLIEGGFMSNPGEAKKIYDPAYRRQMAKAIASGIMDYKKQVE